MEVVVASPRARSTVEPDRLSDERARRGGSWWALGLWAGAIVLSISALVPINNRIASLNTAAPAPGWERDHRKWDALHRVRILLLILALLIVVNALLA